MPVQAELALHLVGGVGRRGIDVCSSPDDADPLAPARSIVLGLIISVVLIWGPLLLALYFAF
jgi:hypothetical protein